MGEEKKLRVMFAGGGTGGHLYPAIAMYESLKETCPDLDVLFVGARSGLESRLLSSLGLPLVLLPGRGVRGASLGRKLRLPFELVSGVFQGIHTILTFRPDVVVGTGGYASVAIVVASVLCQKPRVLQEQNSVPGLANRRLSRFANMILLSYEESKGFLTTDTPAEVIGNPLRKTPEKDRATGARFLGLDPNRPTALIVGGSRGAHSLNVAGSAAAEILIKESELQFIFLTGEGDFDTVADSFSECRDRVAVTAYLEEIHHAYSACDVAVARAGASSVFELAAFGVPTIFVPYPHAADDHQRLNVEPLRQAGGAVVIVDSDLSGERLAGEIKALIDAPDRRDDMERILADWVKMDAAERAAELILEVVKKNGKRHGEVVETDLQRAA